MIFLIKKFRKDVMENKGSFFAISLVIAVGISLFVGLQVTYSTINGSIVNYYKTSNLADCWTYFSEISNNEIEKIDSYKEVKDVQPRMQLQASMGENNVLLQSYDKGYKVNKPVIVNGGTLKSIDDIYFDTAYMMNNKLEIGDSVELKINDRMYNFYIKGSFRSSEYIYYTDDVTQPVPNHMSYGIALISEDFFKSILKMPYNQLIITIKPNAFQKNLITNLEKESDKYIYSTTREQQASYQMVDNKLHTIKKISVILPIVFIILASMIIAISMPRQVGSQRNQIAVLKALGISSHKIIISYMFYPLLTSLLGNIMGIVIGILFFPKIVISTLKILFILPNLKEFVSIYLVFLGFALSLIFGCIATYLACRKILKENPAHAMRPLPPVEAKILFLEKISFIWMKLSYKNRLIIRNISMNKKRFFMSSIGIAFCACILIASFGMKNSLAKIRNSEFKEFRRYDVNAMLSNYSKNYFKIDENKYKNIKYYDIYSTAIATYKQEKTTLNIVNDSAKSMVLYNLNNKQISLKSTGIYVSEKYAKQHGISIGDKLKIIINSPSELSKSFEAVVLDIYKSYTSQGFYTTFEFLKNVNINYPIYSTLVTSKGNPVDLRKELSSDSMFSHVTLKTDQMNNYMDASSSINVIILIIIISSAMLVFTVIYNVSSINIYERRRDIATEKVLGLSIKKINQLIFVENLFLISFSCVLGILFSHWFYVFLCNSITPDEMAFPNALSIKSIPYAVILVFIFTILTNNFLKRKIKSIDMVESLKSVE